MIKRYYSTSTEPLQRFNAFNRMQNYSDYIFNPESEQFKQQDLSATTVLHKNTSNAHSSMQKFRTLLTSEGSFIQTLNPH